MEPVSAIGIVGSLVGIIDVAARSISALRTLQQRWKIVDLTLSLLISQLTTLKAALSQIKEWMSTRQSVLQHHQLAMDLLTSLESCETLLLFIDRQLASLDRSNSKSLSLESKIKAVLQDKTIKECATHLANQSTALNLLLTALNCRSLSERNDLLQAEHNRRVFDQVGEDSASLFCLRDSASFRSSLMSTSARSSMLDISFVFDQELTATKVYHRQWRSLIRRVFHRGRESKESPVQSKKIHANGLTHIRSLGDPIDAQASETKIWVPRQTASGERMLSKVTSILCEDGYNPEQRRGHIYQVILDTLAATLNKMSELSYCTGSVDFPQLLQWQQKPIHIDKLPPSLQQGLVSFWGDSWVKTCYRDYIEGTAHPSATYFLNSIARIVNTGYVPNLEDAAMSSISRTSAELDQLPESARRSYLLTLPVRTSVRNYTFVSWTPQISPKRHWAVEFEGFEAILFTADLAIYDTDTTLRNFLRACRFPWLVGKDIILLLSNVDSFSEQPISAHAPGHIHKDSDARSTKDVIERFLSVNDDVDRTIHVILANNEDKTKTLEDFEVAVQRIQSKKAKLARTS